MSEENQTQVQLQLADLVLALEIIQVASSRGAFKADEYTAIGGCYDRIRSFLLTSGAVKEATEEEEPAQEEPQGESND
jgi:hypothetical protein